MKIMCQTHEIDDGRRIVELERQRRHRNNERLALIMRPTLAQAFDAAEKQCEEMIEQWTLALEAVRKERGKADAPTD